MFKKYKQKIKKHLEEVIKIKESPNSIALGFAIGTAIAILPTFGLGILIGLLIVLIFKKISKISMLAAFVVFNPLITFSLYGLSYKIGDFLLNEIPVKKYSIEILNQLFVYSKRFLLGNFILTIIIASLSYVIIYLLAKKYQKQYKEIIKEPIEKFVKKVK